MNNCIAHTHNRFYNTDGGAYPCCQYDNFVPYTPTDTEWHPGCHRCRHQESVGIPSLRQTLNQELAGERSVEIAVDNTCNLTCVMCSSFASHGIAARERALYGRSAVPGCTVNRRSIEDIDFEGVTRLRLYGGEPLYSPGAAQLIQQVDPTNMHIILPTNCTHTPSKSWQQWLEQARHVTVDLSIDAWGDLNTYQRPGADWHTVKRTLDWWYTNTAYTLNINATSTVYTVARTQTLTEQINTHYKRIHVHIEPCTSPAYLDINCLPGIAQLYGIEPNTNRDLYSYFYTAHQHNNPALLHSVCPELAHYIDANPAELRTPQEMLALVMP